MEFAWDIPNITFKWLKHSNELKSNTIRRISFNDLWNISKTKSGKLIRGGVQIRKGVPTKNPKINKQRGGTIICNWEIHFGTELDSIINPRYLIAIVGK